MTVSTASKVSAPAPLPRLPLFEAVSKHDPQSTAVVHSISGRRFTYGELLGDVSRARDKLYESQGRRDLDGERIAFLVENSYDYVVTLLAVIAARAIAVPLSPAFPNPELQYILDHSQASLLVSSSKYAVKARQVLEAELMSTPAHLELEKHLGGRHSPEKVSLEDGDAGRAGMMLYTSGTTNRPKGVLLPQSALTAQCRSLIEAWDYSSSDHLLHVLPLHHIHGTVNALLTPLLAGSSIEFMFPFNADAAWRRLAAPFLATNATTNGVTNGAANGTPNVIPNGNGARAKSQDKITFFTVVPTVYSRLLASHKTLPQDMQEVARTAISPENLRVCISGSAALPTPVKAAWQRLSRGNVLLERYGMTEVGMALSCGLDFADRVDASVGWPLPSVEARLVDLDTGEVIPEGRVGDELDAKGRPRTGEIQLRGPTIFREYWRNPEATAKEFVEDDGDGKGPWFHTGDVALRMSVPAAGRNAKQPWAKGPMYFIQGRQSADIIKTGGEKVSALEVERELLSLPQVAEAAVVAVPSGRWGQKVGAVIVLAPPEEAQQHHRNGEKETTNGDTVAAADVSPLSSSSSTWTPMDMRRALKSRLANYKIPQLMRVVDSIPRNAMGKINKKQLVAAIFSDAFSEDEL